MRNAALLVVFAAACSSNGNAPADLGGSDPTGVDPRILARPYTLHVPSGYDPQNPTPLVILLHGYGAIGAIYDSYWGMVALADAKTFLYAAPDGTLDGKGKRFWDATDYCCNFTGPPVDDVGYLGAIIDDVAASYTLDKKRVFVVGHSNGGFMAHRFSCDAASRVAAIASLAGAQWLDPSQCAPSEKVSVVQIHGDADSTIQYAGSPSFYPSAHATVATWAQKNGCAGALATVGMLDLESALPGAETKVERYDGCGAVAVELWTIQGGAHIPQLARPAWGEALWSFLSEHAKP